MAPRVVLVGLPAAGKSTVGGELASLLDVPFADTDDLVMEMTGRSVPEIFADDGEQAFREIEAAAIADALLDFEGVLALGGGAVTTDLVREELRSSQVPVALLTAEHEVLLARLAGSGHRPLLVGDTAARLAELAAEREPLYLEVATLTVETDFATTSEVAAELAARLIADKRE
jgi:shikimate kinase